MVIGVMDKTGKRSNIIVTYFDTRLYLLFLFLFTPISVMVVLMVLGKNNDLECQISLDITIDVTIIGGQIWYSRALVFFSIPWKLPPHTLRTGKFNLFIITSFCVFITCCILNKFLLYVKSFKVLNKLLLIRN